MTVPYSPSYHSRIQRFRLLQLFHRLLCHPSWSGSQLQTLVENGLVEDLTSVWESSIYDAGVSQGIADAFTFDGKINRNCYREQQSCNSFPLHNNKTVFDQYGLKEPETFDEFLQLCETLKSNGVTPIALKSDSWAGFIWFQALWNMFCTSSVYHDERTFNASSFCALAVETHNGAA